MELPKWLTHGSGGGEDTPPPPADGKQPPPPSTDNPQGKGGSGKKPPNRIYMLLKQSEYELHIYYQTEVIDAQLRVKD
jgi:hypothetical protein